MATALIRFDLSDPDDEREHRYALAGKDALIALLEIDNRIRAVLKHGDPSPEMERVLEEIRQMVPGELLETLA